MLAFISERKEIIKILVEYFGVKPKYMGMPTCAYEIVTQQGTYTIDLAGKIKNSEGEEVELESLNKKSGQYGFRQTSLIKKSFGFNADIVADNFSTGINEAKIETIEDFSKAIEDIGA